MNAGIKYISPLGLTAVQMERQLLAYLTSQGDRFEGQDFEKSVKDIAEDPTQTLQKVAQEYRKRTNPFVQGQIVISIPVAKSPASDVWFHLLPHLIDYIRGPQKEETPEQTAQLKELYSSLKARFRS